MSVEERHIAAVGGKLGPKGAEYTQVWQHRLTTSSEGPITIWNHFKLNRPYFGDIYQVGDVESDAGSYLQEMDTPERAKGAENIWTTTLHYKPLTDDSKVQPHKDGSGALTTNPLDFRPKVSIAYAGHTKPVEKATYRAGFLHVPELVAADTVRPITNSNLVEPFDPPFEKDQSRKVIRIRLNTLYFRDDHADSYIDSLNLTTLNWAPELAGTVAGLPWGITRETSYAPYTLKVANITASPRRESFEISDVRYDVEYYEVEVEIHYDRDGWRIEALDRGLHRGAQPGDPDGRGGSLSLTDAPAGVPLIAAIVDNDGLAVNHPVLLNGAGQPLRDLTAPVFITYSQYREQDLSNCEYIRAALVYSP